MKKCRDCGKSELEVKFYPHRKVCCPCIVAYQRKRRAKEASTTSDISVAMRSWGRVDVEA